MGLTWIIAAIVAVVALAGISLYNKLVRLRNTVRSAWSDIDVQLKEIEDTVEAARRYYNAVVRDFNTTIEQFPSNLIAWQFRFEKNDFFELESQEVERKPVRVAF